MRAAFLACVLVACASAAPTTTAPVTTPPATDTGRWVELAGGGRGYFVATKGEGKHPALVVIQEWWGLNDWIKRNAERFASQGYDALAPKVREGNALAQVLRVDLFRRATVKTVFKDNLVPLVGGGVALISALVLAFYAFRHRRREARRW